MIGSAIDPQNRLLGPLWVLATETGWIVGMGLAVLISQVINPLTSGLLRAIAWGILGLLVGTALGISQSFVLKNFLTEDNSGARVSWIRASIAGWGLGLAVVIGLGAGERFGFGIAGAVLGLFTGTAQIVALPGRFHAPGWWLLASISAWFAGMGAIDLLDQVVGVLLTGVIAGSITGAVLFGGAPESKIERAQD
jgi:hypothetical protein